MLKLVPSLFFVNYCNVLHFQQKNVNFLLYIKFLEMQVFTKIFHKFYKTFTRVIIINNFTKKCLSFLGEFLKNQ